MKDLFSKQQDYFFSDKTLEINFRIEQLEKLKDLVIVNETKIAEALKSDLGKCHFEAFSSEIGFIIEEIQVTIKNLKKWLRPKNVSTPMWMWPSKSQIIQDPYGVTLIIAPWNYPFQLMMAPLIGAIAAGNTAILKPSELTPATEKIIAELISKTYPEEYIKVVVGGVKETTELLELPFDFIFFTGSTQVGKIIMQAASQNLTPVCLELGGKSPCIVDETADIVTAAKRIVWGKFMNAGQTCVAPDFLLVHESKYELLIANLKQTIHEFYGSDLAKIKENDQFGRIVNERHLDRLMSYFKEEDVIFGGDVDREQKYISPTLIGPINGLNSEHPIMQEEIFGPLLPIIKYKSLDEEIKKLKRMPKPLALYLFTRSEEAKEKVTKKLSFGGGCINECLLHLANPELPFGGVGPSGLGAYHGKFSIETFSHQKSVFDHANWPDPSLRYPPYNESKFKIIRKLLT